MVILVSSVHLVARMECECVPSYAQYKLNELNWTHTYRWKSIRNCFTWCCVQWGMSAPVWPWEKLIGKWVLGIAG